MAVSLLTSTAHRVLLGELLPTISVAVLKYDILVIVVLRDLDLVAFSPSPGGDRRGLSVVPWASNENAIIAPTSIGVLDRVGRSLKSNVRGV